MNNLTFLSNLGTGEVILIVLVLIIFGFPIVRLIIAIIRYLERH
ncbi:MAG: hypothetical protein ACI4A8_06355 [Muribaculaceae bacterium]